MKTVGKETRVINFLIDTFVILIIWIAWSVITENKFIGFEEFYVVFFLYYFLCEVLVQQTIGKKITGSVVVTTRGEPAGIFKIFIRTFMRLIPLDILSYMFGNGIGFHDMVSLTRVKLKEKKSDTQ